MLNPVIDGGVTSPVGFKAGVARCGLRRPGDDRPDIALIFSEAPAAAAAVFTANRVKAAPVLVSQENLTRRMARAIVANAGIANACTGEKGILHARRMAEVTAAALGVAAEEVVVASTGVIGSYLPIERVEEGIRFAAGSLSKDGGGQAARAITTTDTVEKEAAVSFSSGGATITIGAMAKGSGMIRPQLATMLCFITTDAAVEPDALQAALSHAVDESFNMITVDNDTSTNDCVVVLANGQAGNPVIRAGTGEFQLFQAALSRVCIQLAQAVARDGEGATKLLEVAVRGGASREDARRAALAVAGSNLVKTAVFGGDANWGRVMAALGYSGASFNPSEVDISLGPLLLVKGGCSAGFDESLARELLGQEKVRIEVNLNSGWHGAVAWGCDLSYDYVRINGSYRS